MLSHFSRVQLFETPWTVSLQSPLSMGFSRQESWSGLPFPSPGNLPDSGIEPVPPAVEAQSSNHWMAREIPDLSILSPGMSCGHLLEKTRPGSKNTGCRGPEAGSGRAYLAAMRPCQAAGTRSAEALKQDQVWCVWQQEGHCGGK